MSEGTEDIREGTEGCEKQLKGWKITDEIDCTTEGMEE
jgi:hypothetical protein